MPPIELITTLGAAGLAIWIIYLTFVKGVLHPDSEVKGLRADKRELAEANKVLYASNKEAADTLKTILSVLEGEDSDEKIIEMLVEILARLPEKEGTP